MYISEKIFWNNQFKFNLYEKNKDKKKKENTF